MCVWVLVLMGTPPRELRDIRVIFIFCTEVNTLCTPTVRSAWQQCSLTDVIECVSRRGAERGRRLVDAVTHIVAALFQVDDLAHI